MLIMARYIYIYVRRLCCVLKVVKDDYDEDNNGQPASQLSNWTSNEKKNTDTNGVQLESWRV